jgi:hypothetical protein
MRFTSVPDHLTQQMPSLKDPSILALYAYWSRQRAGAAAPRRDAIAPADIAPLLGDIFILDAARGDRFPFRLAGTRLCAAFGRELRDEGFLTLWARHDAQRMRAALGAVTAEAAAIEFSLAATNERDQTVAAAMILLPLSHDGRSIDRILGLLAPPERPYWLGLHPVRAMSVVAASRLDASNAPAPAAHAPAAAQPLPAAATARPADMPDTRPRPRLVVLEGGRQ